MREGEIRGGIIRDYSPEEQASREMYKSRHEERMRVLEETGTYTLEGGPDGTGDPNDPFLEDYKRAIAKAISARGQNL